MWAEGQKCFRTAKPPPRSVLPFVPPCLRAFVPSPVPRPPVPVSLRPLVLPSPPPRTTPSLSTGNSAHRNTCRTHPRRAAPSISHNPRKTRNPQMIASTSFALHTPAVQLTHCITLRHFRSESDGTGRARLPPSRIPLENRVSAEPRPPSIISSLHTPPASARLCPSGTLPACPAVGSRRCGSAPGRRRGFAA